MTTIHIKVDSGLPDRSGRINVKTWQAIKEAKGGSSIFPEENSILVGQNPFEPQYLLLAVNEDIEENTLFVSSDVKSLVYKDRTTIEG